MEYASSVSTSRSTACALARLEIALQAGNLQKKSHYNIGNSACDIHWHLDTTGSWLHSIYFLVVAPIEQANPDRNHCYTSCTIEGADFWTEDLLRTGVHLEWVCTL